MLRQCLLAAAQWGANGVPALHGFLLSRVLQHLHRRLLIRCLRGRLRTTFSRRIITTAHSDASASASISRSAAAAATTSSAAAAAAFAARSTIATATSHAMVLLC